MPVEPLGPTARRRRGPRLVLLALALVLLAGLVLPEQALVPVQGASARDWNPRSFWFEPWGASGVHKGIDIFAAEGRPVLAAVPGLVLYRGELGRGGQVVAVLGPKWRVHYYAHLQQVHAGLPRWVARGQALGSVGRSGNAADKPPHLHYAVVSLVPLPWRAASGNQGWKRMFFIDPGELLGPASRAEGLAPSPRLAALSM
ncbi:M23 family metallopeptidase [Aquabacterium sp. A7-Y]|uniref:M23 family metallopeptidase n=1 Tax=Aquabacterium sp. A7-Y TaxID=1349605 RepID=UPI00223E3793|nr:M23 family metallopeptidase [Aquabacterium sp. A7-Y]MCW7539274.1 M23 family metallopeptidase [Aquabacterium sp. A7-Y]